MGETVCTGNGVPFAFAGRQSRRLCQGGRAVCGTYLHGIFDAPEFSAKLVSCCWRKGHLRQLFRSWTLLPGKSRSTIAGRSAPKTWTWSKSTPSWNNGENRNETAAGRIPQAPVLPAQAWHLCCGRPRAAVRNGWNW
ncbi:MAG: hypothetical protein ACLTXT_07790 [Ruminococcus callidus]